MPLAEAKKESYAGEEGRTESSAPSRFGITLFRNGKKLRTIFPEKSVTIGRDRGNDIVYHLWSGTERFNLVEKIGANRFVLNITDKVVGKVRSAKSEVDFRDLICSGVLPRRNGLYQFEIAEGKEEELQFGELTFKFSFETPPAPPEIVSISKIMPTRRSLLATMDDEDRRFTYLFLSILTLSVFFLIFAFRVGTASNMIRVQDIPEVVAQLVDVEDLQNEMSGTGESKTEGAGGGGGGQNYGPSNEGPGVLSTGLLGLLTTEGFSGGPSVVDILGGSGGVGDIDAILGGLGGLTTSGAGGGLGGGGLGGLGGLGGSGGMDLAALLGGGGGGGFDSSELETAGTVTLTGPSSISGTGAGESGRTSSAISSVISAHMAGLQSAYNAQLKRNPNLGGKIVVTFTVNAQGIVTNAYVSSSTMNSPELESQVVSRIYGWKFPAVSGGEVTVVYPFVFIKI